MKKKLPYILAIVVGIVVLSVGIYFNYFTSKADGATKEVYVPSSDIGMYEVVSLSDIKKVPVSINQDTTNYATGAEELVNKVAVSNLYEDTLVSKKAVTSLDKIEDVVFVVIQTDYSRTAGAKPGDLVDVFEVKEDIANNVRQTLTTKIAENVRVVSVTNDKGTDIDNQSSVGAIATGTVNVEAIKLAVKPEEAPKLLKGALSRENAFVLVMKYSNVDVKNAIEDPEETEIN